MMPSAKIAIGIVAAAATIGALHIMVFQQAAKDYQAAKGEYDRVVSQYQGQGSARPVEDINKFRYTTLKHEVELWETIQQLNVAYPDRYNPLKPEAFSETAQQQDYWTAYEYLQNKAVEGSRGEGPRLDFLGPSGWQFSWQLPEKYRQRGVIEDLVNTLINEDKLIESLGPTNPLREERIRVFNSTLADVGLNLEIRKQLVESFGTVVGTLYTINRIDLVMKAMPEDSWGGRNPTQRLQLMYKLFRMEWPKNAEGVDIKLHGYQQLRALRDMIERADKHEIELIFRVRLQGYREVRYKEPSQAGSTEGAPQEVPDEGFGGDGIPSKPGWGDQSKKEQPGEMVGTAMPMEIFVKGKNAAVMGFFYEVSNDVVPYEVDRLKLIQATNEEGKVWAQAFVNVVTFVMIPELKGPDGNTLPILGDSDVERFRNKARFEMLKLAEKVGSRELAAQDGIVEIQGSQTRLLVEPEPEPPPDQPAAPEPFGM